MPEHYLPRTVDQELDELLPVLPALLLDGPKGVGKTETALRRARTVRRLDNDAERSVVAASPDLATDGDAPVLIDEWHRVPSTWDSVKRAVDRDSRGGQFLLTGSAPGIGAPVHSGAGRITTVRMRPMTLPRRGVSVPSVSLRELLSGESGNIRGRSQIDLRGYTAEILASGFPGLRGAAGRALTRRLDGYVDRIVEKDLPEEGFRGRRPATLRSWLRAYAAATATDASWETIRAAATPGSSEKPAKTTTGPYVDVLTMLRILDEVPAWEPGGSRITRLTRSSKHHLADPALAARLVGVGMDALLSGGAGVVAVPRDGTFLGGLFESLAALTVRVFAQASDAAAFHLRDYDSRHEVDLIVERDDGRVVAAEVKLAASVHADDAKALRWLKERIGDRLISAMILTTGPEAYRLPDGIAVVPLALLGP